VNSTFPIDPVKIEHASYASWPSFEQQEHNGWILRFADGYTKRCNSANTLSPVNVPLEEQIHDCEAFFKERSQPPIFRLLSFMDDPRVDSYLADAGYTFLDPSLVLYKKTDNIEHCSKTPESLDASSWLKLFCQLTGSDFTKHETHIKILNLVPNHSLFTMREHEGRVVSCGLGVIHDKCFGLFDIVTDPQVRNQGHGTELLRAMLSWAKGKGAEHFYLQVVANNVSAIRLYEKLGFRRLYCYWYRVKR
jgi:N-acetylglutamate synthase